MLERLVLSLSDHIYNWLGLLFAPTTVIAIIVLLISLQQYYVAKEKLKLDSYDKRYHLFEVARNLLDLSKGRNFRPDNSYIAEYVGKLEDLASRADDAIFLFNDSNIHNRLKITINRAEAYLFWTKELMKSMNRSKGGSPSPTVRNSIISDQHSINRTRHELQVFLVKESEQLADLFSHHLTIDNRSLLSSLINANIESLSRITSNIRKFINGITNQYINIELFPLSMYSLMLIAALEAVFLICLWIIVG